METKGSRLREERERVGLNQDELGVAPKTQRFYENDERSPDAEYLEAAHAKGIDVLYVVVGKRSGESLDSEQSLLIEKYNQAPPALRSAAVAVLLSGQVPNTPQGVTIHGDVGSQVSGGQNSVKVTMGTKTKKR